MLVRKAVPADIPAVTAIYEALLDREERGELSTGWTRGVYPTEQTALDALAAGTLYVLEDGGRVAAAAKLDQNQMAQYSQCTWRHDAPPEQVLVLHILVVDPTVKGKGYGTAFVAFYEQLARETDRPYLRIDTNARNTPAGRCTKSWATPRRASWPGPLTASRTCSWCAWRKRYKTKDKEVPEMALIHVNESDFREQVLENSGTVLVDFWANWCGPCRMLGPVLEQLAADRPDVTVAKVDVDENMSLAAAYGVESIPMLLVFKNGQLVNKSIGFVSQPEIEKLLQ